MQAWGSSFASAFKPCKPRDCVWIGSKNTSLIRPDVLKKILGENAEVFLGMKGRGYDY